MKKQIGIFTAILFAVSTLMVSCSPEVHEHTFSEEWKTDENFHWKECTGCKEQLESAEHEYEWTVTKEATCTEEGSKTGVCEVCKKEVTEKIDAKGHSFGDWITTKAATEEETGSKERVCDVCKYKDTEAIEKLAHTHKFATDWTSDETNHWHASTCGHEVTEGKTAHTFGDWTITKEPTEEAEGSREKSCTVCEYTVPEVIAKLEHTHKFASEWTSDETNHWKECRCGEKIESAEHTYGTWKVTTEPTTNAEGKNEKNCSNCGHVYSVVLQPAPEGFRFVKGTTITGTESWTPTSSVFVSERKLTIPDLIVSDHEVTRGEYKAVMGSVPSYAASAYDKDGNKLTGDKALNNPVNYVNWYDALVYCNKLSIKENLTPCYSIDGSTDPAAWGEVPTEWNDPLRRDTWDAATCDFEASGYRLPTEAEWEWLARGGENYIYFAGSDTVGKVAWYTGNTNDTGTREVKTKAPNGYGLYDMSGNVWEWCWDWYGSISDSTAADGAAPGDSRVLRGGSWSVLGIGCQVSCRDDYDYPYHLYTRYGFRVVRNAK
ncbi:MAG: formylglycine-generating enzyme family protein [Treponema bryantii]|nr:formylglycine-generating enzyme family protein [Treponema bryantii]